MSKGLPTIRRLLVLLSLVCVLPAASLAGWLIVEHYQRERRALEVGAVATARAMAAALDDRVRNTQAGLSALAQSPLIKSGDWVAFHRDALAVQGIEQLDTITLVTDSAQVLSTQVPYGTPISMPPSPAMQAVVRSGQPAVTGVFDSPVTRRPVVALVVPAAGPARYALAAHIDLKQLQEYLLRQQLPAGWIATVFDSSGRIAARSLDHARYVGTSGNPALRERMSQVPEDALDSLTVDGLPVVSAFSRVPSTGWSVAIAIPRAALNAPVRQSVLLLLAGAALVLAITAGAAWILGSRIGKSVQGLTAASGRLARGERFAAPPASFREARELGEAFEAASAQITRTQQALSDKAERLNAILDTAMDAIISVGDDSRILLFNHAAEELFGIPRGQALGLRLENLIPTAHRDAHAGRMLAFAAEERPGRMMAEGRVIRGLRANGQEFPAEASISTTIENGQRLFTVILRDVTERERHMTALTRSNLELQRFAFVASHDLRSPLRSIMGFLDLLKLRHADALGEKGSELLDRAKRAGQQMDELTADLLSYARLDAEAKPMTQVDTGTALEDAQHMLDAAMQEAGAQVEAGPLPTVRGDRAQLVQLFQNLLGNAIKYCRGSAPRVQVSAERGVGEWLFHFKDNGIGIEAHHLERVFEIFQRLHTQLEFSGSGIGLAVCRRVVERHGGRIWCTSTPGAGSTFSFAIADPRSTA
jgi:PAS domain S-box-containing protein